MIALSKVLEIKRLLDEGLSHRKISQLVGASRSTVAAVAISARRCHDERLNPLHDPFEMQCAGEPARCPTCGGRIYPPCRLCHVRCLIAEEKQIAQLLRNKVRRQALRRLLLALYQASLDRERAAEALRQNTAASQFDEP